MTRWYIEKSGTGIEKSGTGIEKSGTGIEKSGTGIEKSGTGIEKSGTGIRKGFLACTLAAVAFTTSVSAVQSDEIGNVALSVNDHGDINVTWMFENSVFLGFGNLESGFANIRLMEVSRGNDSREFAGGAFGSKLEIAGGGTGNRTKIAGGGTGSSTQIAGGGTGASTEIAGGGTGASTDIAGGGTGSSTEIAGGGTGSSTDIAGGGTGSSNVGEDFGESRGRLLIAGGGTGSESFAITLPEGTQLSMEISLNCGSASVYVLDAAGYEVISFDNVKVSGAVNDCGGSRGSDIIFAPGEDHRQ